MAQLLRDHSYTIGPDGKPLTLIRRSVKPISRQGWAALFLSLWNAVILFALRTRDLPIIDFHNRIMSLCTALVLHV